MWAGYGGGRWGSMRSCLSIGRFYGTKEQIKFSWTSQTVLTCRASGSSFWFRLDLKDSASIHVCKMASNATLKHLKPWKVFFLELNASFCSRFPFIQIYWCLHEMILFKLAFKKKTHLLTAPPLSEKSFTRGEVCLRQRGPGHAFDHDTGCLGGG